MAVANKIDDDVAAERNGVEDNVKEQCEVADHEILIVEKVKKESAADLKNSKQMVVAALMADVADHQHECGELVPLETDGYFDYWQGLPDFGKP